MSELIKNPTGNKRIIIERTEAPGHTANSYFVADRDQGTAVIIDGNGEAEPIIRRAEAGYFTVAAILITHQHFDHVIGIEKYRAHFGAPVMTHVITDAAVVGLDAQRHLIEGEMFRFGALIMHPLLIEGHCAGQMAFRFNEDKDVFCGDALFKGTVGGNFAPGNTGYEHLKASAMRLAQFPPDTVLHPGHTLPTTAGEEWENNPFIRIWRGLDPEGTEQVTVWDRPATLVLWAPDYDGTNKAWVRFADTGENGIVGGSQVVRARPELRVQPVGSRPVTVWGSAVQRRRYAARRAR